MDATFSYVFVRVCHPSKRKRVISAFSVGHAVPEGKGMVSLYDAARNASLLQVRSDWLSLSPVALSLSLCLSICPLKCWCCITKHLLSEDLPQDLPHFLVHLLPDFCACVCVCIQLTPSDGAVLRSQGSALLFKGVSVLVPQQCSVNMLAPSPPIGVSTTTTTTGDHGTGREIH